jgi:hypothetical protein
MNIRATLFLLLVVLFVSLPTSAQSFGDIVGEKDFDEARKLARKVITASGIGLSPGLTSRDNLADGSKPAGKFFITHEPTNPLRMTGCIVFAAAPLKTGSYISHSLIISTADVQSGSYITDSVIITTGGVRVGSYASDTTFQAKQVSVGSKSSSCQYYNVTPRIGKSGSSDKVLESDIFNDILGF